MRPRAGLVLLAVLGAAGCDSMVDGTPGGSTTGTSTSTSEGTSDGPVVSTTGATSSDGPADGTTLVSTEDDGGYEEDDGGTGCTFTCPNPPPPTPPPGGGGGGFLECDLQAQDCPEGEKCMPWANDGGAEWNATRCSPIADDPTQAGDLCTVEGSGTSGIDDCDLGLVCWQVNPETNVGLCHIMCGLEPPGCEPPLVCGEVEIAPMCVEPCDPLDAASCPAGTACGFFMGTALVCQPAPDGSATAGTPCDAATACEAGTLCSYDAGLDCGNDVGQGCCAVPCDVNDPVACTGPEVCEPWFPLPAPPELAYLGVCVAP